MFQEVYSCSLRFHSFYKTSTKTTVVEYFFIYKNFKPAHFLTDMTYVEENYSLRKRKRNSAMNHEKKSDLLSIYMNHFIGGQWNNAIYVSPDSSKVMYFQVILNFIRKYVKKLKQTSNPKNVFRRL